jgi:DNA-directed RNA polymerase subunit N (RpoN/RPB10)
MYPFIVCFCGRSIGDLYDAFNMMRMDKYAKAIGAAGEIDPVLLPISESVQIELNDIFDELNINMVCCRMHLHALVEFKRVY